jgi:hypothetical protein
LPLSEAAKTLLTTNHTVRQYLDTLLAAPLPVDALRVLAVGLPKPEAVWWACVGVLLGIPKPWKAEAEAAVAAAEKWVLDPSDANRRECNGAAEAAGWDTAAGCAAGAAWLSGGSLSPAQLPPVHPRDDLTGQTVAGSLLIAASTDPATTSTTISRFLQFGVALAAGQLKRGEQPK